MKFKILLLILLLSPILSAAERDSKSEDIISPIQQITDAWYDKKPADSFELIVESFSDGGKLNSIELTNLTGVRKIEKLVEGKGDEDAYFITKRFIALSGFNHTLRMVDIVSGKSYWLPESSYLLIDKLGAITYQNRYTYYIKPKPANDSYILYEFDCKKKSSRSLGKFPTGSFMTKYDEENGWIQISSLDFPMLKTFDLDKKSELQTTDRITARLKRKTIKPEVFTGHNKLTIEFGKNDDISISYPRVEFLDGYEPDSFYFDNEHPDSVLVKSGWYPGLYILIDVKRGKAEKIFIPEYLSPEKGSKWYLEDNNFYLWMMAGEDAGLYKIDLESYPGINEFIEMVKRYKLVRPENNTMIKEKA